MSIDQEKYGKELIESLQSIANEHNVLIMSFVAPASIVRKSPVDFEYARIRIKDLYNMEEAVNNLREKNLLPKKVHLIIHTPGGLLDASIKISNYLLAVFDEIEAYVPYEAASGGTILCLAAKTIVMDVTSNLTSIDPQVSYKGERIAASTYEQAIDDFQKKFPTSTPNELPCPYQQMGHSFDPFIQKEMNKTVWDTLTFAYGLLKKSQKPESKEQIKKLTGAAISLVKSDKPHDHIYAIEEAKDLGLNITDDKDKIKVLSVYKKWVSVMLDLKDTNHIIETVYPMRQRRGGRR